MERLAILFCAMAPAIVLLLYGVAKARGAWDDAVVWHAFFAGSTSAVFALIPELLLEKALAVDGMSPLHGAATQALVVAAIPEEIAKFVALLYTARRHRDGLGLRDLITLALAVALGFAAVENLAYLAGSGDWQMVALSRAITAVPGHGIDGLAMGALVTAACLHERGRRIWLAAALGLPILLHACYDFPLMLVARNPALLGVLPAWLLMSVLATIGVLYLCNKMRSAASVADDRAGRVLDGPPRSFSPRQAGIAMLLAAPLLAAIKLLLDGQVGILEGGALSLLPIILGADLLLTGRHQAAPQQAHPF